MQDILVIGGGINGSGIARDAAGRGLSVTLVEKDDLVQHTSSASTKLVHGGLRNFAQTAEDVLWRRSKLGLHLPADAAEEIEAWFARLDRGGKRVQGGARSAIPSSSRLP